MAQLSRRRFLLGALAGGVASVLAACGLGRQEPSAPAPATSGALSSATSAGPAPSGSAAQAAGSGTIPGPGAATANAPSPAFLEVVGRPTDRSITANVLPAKDGRVVLEAGRAPGAYDVATSPTAVTAGTPVELALDGLAPATRYWWRVRDAATTGPEHSFVTRRPPGSAFVFDVQGDSHPERVGKMFNAALYERTLRGAASDAPDFFLTLGDDFSVDTLRTVNASTVRDLYVKQRSWLGLVGAPLFLVNGNHEQAAMANLDGTADNVAVWAQRARNANYPQPAPDAFFSGDADEVPYIGPLRDYYAWTWGDALFMVIDFYWHSRAVVDNPFGPEKAAKPPRDIWDVTLGEAQYRWLRQTLEQSRARYRFVFAHHVLGTGRGGIEDAGTGEWGDTRTFAAKRPGWGKTIHQVLVDNHVTAFFQGHDHIYARQELDGVVYQSLPVPGDDTYSLFNADAYRSGEKLPGSGRLRVTVAPDQVRVEYVRSWLDRPDEVAASYAMAAR